MSASPIVPVILCGGSGTRLWPLSRTAYPKQFLQLLGQQSLLQQTVARCATLARCTAPLLVTHHEARFLAAEHLREMGVTKARILLEPMRKNTGPAIASAALTLLEQADDALMLVLPSDHAIADQAAFALAVERATEGAQGGHLMTFGIVPHAAETGYGYLRVSGNARQSEMRLHTLLGFVEKPDRPTAEAFIASGQYFWNSGMFLFRASQLIDELARHAPVLLAACQRAVAGAKKEADFIWLNGDAYADNPEIAIDYALMEHTESAAMVALDAGWSDIGSWASVWQLAQKDTSGNAANGDVLLQDCHDCMVHGKERLIAAVGLKDIAIIDTPDALLVIDRQHAQDARTLVATLLTQDRTEASEHRRTIRPWGAYDAIGSGMRFQVKRITVKPGAKLSLQLHHHRAEHWIVVAGTARVVHGDQDYLLTENQSAYIGIGVIHSLENPGKIPLELIEVQSGSYLGEDDIVRLQDRYGRA